MPTSLSSRERLERVMRGDPVDRVPIRLWGVDPLRAPERPCWEPLHALVEQYGLDTILEWEPVQPPGIPPTGGHPPMVDGADPEVRTEERATATPDWFETRYTVTTPAGELTRIDAYHRGGKPGYTVKHLVESVEDAHRWLSIPVADLPPRQAFGTVVERLGDRGVVMTLLSEGVWSVNDAVGSELYAYWIRVEPDLVHEMISKVQRRLLAQVKRCLAAGVGPLFGWAGPEFCIPPLASPQDFDDFCFRYDKPIVDLIHDGGGLVWVHCHGDMDPVLERFVEMGVDCLNPIEPPPVGKLTLADAKHRVGGRMTLEGGIEIADIELLSTDMLASEVEQVMSMGKPGGRFILCPSSQHHLWPDMGTSIAENYGVVVRTALALATY